MHKFIFIFFCLIPLSVTGQNDWKHWNSVEGNFTIFVPGDMQEKIQTVETDLGTLEYHQFFYQSTEENPENYIYMVNYVDYPLGSLSSDSLELVNTFFEATKEEAVASVEGELRYADPISLYDFPGQIWRIDYNDGQAILKSKSFVVNNRFYSIQVATSKAMRFNDKMNQYLDSFKLLN